MSDLFENSATAAKEDYSARDIEVLEGLDPVRHRPGMYIGGTDEQALHHLVAEILDNSMDEAVAGYATRIDIAVNADLSVTVTDNGRGIPIDNHPKYPGKSALEVIFTTLHSGGKFGGNAYKVSGGLHGVGSSVVNALSKRLVVEVARDKKLYRQEYSQGKPLTPLELVGNAPNRRGTSITFLPDEEIFGSDNKFVPAKIYRMARSKAFLFKGIKIFWKCAPELLNESDGIPAETEFNFPNGLLDFLNYQIGTRGTINRAPFSGEAELSNDEGKVEWAITWPEDEKGFCNSYCNTVITPQGGTHEQGFRTALLKSLKEYADMANIKKAAGITAEDFLSDAAIMLSVFIRDPQFQGQTKDKLTSTKAAYLVEKAVKKAQKQYKDNFKGVILDVRNNPGGLLDQAVSVADLFLNQGEIVSTRSRNEEDTVRYNAKEGDIINGMPIVVMINDGSASASEIVAGALQDHKRAVLLGEKSFGKGSVQTVVPLGDYGAMRLTTARYYTPSGRSIQAKGIEPDVEVHPAKVEELEKTFEFSEAEYRNALKNENDNEEKNDNKKEKEEKDDWKKDYQLSRAVDLVKALGLYSSAK